MDLEEITKGIAAKLGLEGFAVNNGRAIFEMDGMPVMLSESDDAILISGLICDAEPPDCGAHFANMLLGANLTLFADKPVAFARNEASGAYFLVERLAKDTINIDGFCETLEAFANLQEDWRRTVEAFRPVAEEATKISEKNAAEASALNTLSGGGFMRV